MKIRKCPDCNGTGKIYIPPSLRERIYHIPDPSISSTAIKTIREKRPEYEICRLCAGFGKIYCMILSSLENDIVT